MKRIGLLLAMSLLMVIGFSMSVYASSENMARGGYAYLNSDCSNGMSCADAGTVPGVYGHYSSTYLETAYEDGTTDSNSSGFTFGSSSVSHGWGWVLDFSSTHKLFSDATNCYDSVGLWSQCYR